MSKPFRVFEWPEVAAALSEVYGYDILHVGAFMAIVDDGKGTIHIKSPGVKVIYEDPLSRDVERFLERNEDQKVPSEGASEGDTVAHSTSGGVAEKPGGPGAPGDSTEASS